MRHGSTLWLVFVFVQSIVALTAAAQDAPPRRFDSRIGVNVKFIQGQPASGLRLLPELGVKWVRDSVLWADLEPTAGQYAPLPDSFLERLAFYKANDIGICFGVWYDNPKAYPNSPENPRNAWNPDAYGRFAAEMARRLRASGVRFVLELYNEPHNSLKDLGGKWNGEPPSPWLDHYVAMVTSAVREIKAVDPSIKTLVDDDMWVLHYRFLEKGLPKELDGLAVHPYVRSWPETSATEPDTSWTQPFVTVDADRSLKSAVRRLRDFGTAKLGRTPAIWFTEWGWPVGEPIHDRPMTEDLLAALIPRAFLTSADAGVEVLLWFSIVDSVDGPMGLTDNAGRRRLPFQAMKYMTARLGRTTRLEHVEGATHPTSGVQAYRLSGDGVDTVWVVWNIDGDAAIDIDGVPDSLRPVDVLGKPLPPVTAADGRARLTVGRSPIYLSGLRDDCRFTITKADGLVPVYLFP